MKHALTARVSRESLLKHFLICGSSGAGKTLLMQAMFYDLARTSAKKRDVALILLEPHGDFSAKAALSRVIDKDRLVFISSAINRLANTNERYTFTFNPFENDGTDEQRESLTAELTLALAELLEDSTHGLTIQMTTLLRAAIAVTLASPEPNIITLKRVFMDGKNEDLLEFARKFPHPQIQDFFVNSWASDSYKLTKNSVLTKLSYFLNDIHLYNILATTKSTLNLEQSIEDGKIIIVHTPKGVSAFVQSVIGRLVVARVFAAALRREAKEPKDRKQTFLFIDEFQSYLTSSLAASLQEARKYSLGLVIATQSLKQIENTTMKNSILTNTFLKAVSLIDADNRATFAREMGVTADDIAKLLPLQFMVKKLGNNEAFRFTVPILSDLLYLNKKEQAGLYDFLVHKSGLYTKVPPLPPAPPTATIQEKKNTNDKKKTNQNTEDPFNGLTPAF